ncbi:MAG: PilT/PilU family type 4a pilus ATPase [Deltaproteobacteria bacterium]|nr:PilT/PilU family type 4a pilus ATPase [Deltaproteobacteria bacterium]
MQFFGAGRATILEKLITTAWRTPEERDQLLAQVRELGLKAQEAIPLLWHQDPGARAAGTEAFLTNVDLPAIQKMFERAAEQPAHIRAYAGRVLNRVPNDLIVQFVEGLLKDKNPAKVRQGWEVAVNLQGEVAARYVERAITEAPPALRAPALQRLLQTKPAATMVDLLVKAATDEDARLAATAMEALSKIPDPKLLDLMMSRMTKGDATTRDLAVGWLRAQGQANPQALRARLLDLLASGEDAARHACVDILLLTGDTEATLQEILIFARDLVGWLRTRILETLRTFGDQVFKPALNLLSHPDPEVRTSALVLAENFQDARLVDPLSAMLSDPDWWLRITACDALGRLKDERAVPALVKALEDDESRWAAIDALAQIASPSALKPLAGMLRDPRPEVRTEVVRAFSKFTDARLLNLLAQVKEKDPSSDVRTRAAEVLRDMQERLHVDVTDAEKGTAAVAAGKLARPIDRMLAHIREIGASDCHITVDEAPWVRFAGTLTRLEGSEVLGADETKEWIFSILNARQSEELARTGELDFCHAIPEVGRYRVNAFHQRKGWCASFRVIPNLPPTFADLRLPGRLTELLDYHQGIIIISGPAGCGKSTTLAAIVNLINETKSDHVITLEDPIEFVHPVKSALVNQREVGTHTLSFARALRAALREDPDVIIVGEMRDVDTVRLALTAAETGHLVVGTLHTTSAVATVDRLIKSFPPDEQAQVRMGLSESLKYVVCQSLIKRKDGKGRVAVYEVLKGAMSVGTLIRDNKLTQLPSMMQIGRQLGMQTVDIALQELVTAGLISAETAWARAEKPETFEAMCSSEFLKEKGVGA